MKWSRVGAVCLALSIASYASAAPPEDYLGKPWNPPAVTGPAAPAGAGAAALGDDLIDRRTVARYRDALAGLLPDAASLTRGAKETQVYAAASPSVVLIVTRDGLGSGALIHSDGTIITNLHVVGDNPVVGVVFKPVVEGDAISEADVVRAEVIKRDAIADLALIKAAITPPHAKVLSLGSTASIQVGADVHAIGHPTGEAWTYTRGIVSQIRRDFTWQARESDVEHKATVIQTQTPINPGNSGGPLLTDDLQLVGINSFIAQGEGLNFAVSADDVAAFLKRPGDRLAPKAIPTQEKAKTCRGEVLASRPAKDPKGTESLVDLNCDGKGDVVLFEPDDRSVPTMAYYDDDEDGRIDRVLINRDHDGDADGAYYDTDGDGKLDMEGFYRDGEKEPYRYERLSN